jgi:glycogenin glucosyltransferase
LHTRILASKHTEADFIYASKNPEEKLEQLRRSSLLEFEHLKSPEHPTAPLRALPEHSVDHGASGAPLTTDGAAAAPVVDSAAKEKPAATEKPVFTVPDFGSDGAAEKTEDVLSPKEPTERVLSPTQEQ